MMRIVEILSPGTWIGPPADRVTLDVDGRRRRRAVFVAEGGTTILLDLPTATVLAHGAGLELEDGRIIEMLAKPEPLLEVRARDGTHLLRLAWHLGNRHLEAQVLDDRLLIRRDHVIAHMLEHLGARVSEIVAPFDPEGGAYSGAGHGHQDHGHDHHRHEHE